MPRIGIGPPRSSGSVIAEIAGVSRTSGSIDARHVEQLQQLGVPARRCGCREQGARGVGGVGRMDLAAGQPPQQEASIVPKASSPVSARARAPGDVVEDPGDLGAGEIGIEQQAGLRRDRASRGRRASARADSRGAAVLPDDGVVDRLAGGAVPDDGRLALVGDADARRRRRASSLASASAPRQTSTVARQISSGSCSTQPGWGRSAAAPSAPTPRGRPDASNTIARVLVVPWSMARMYFAAMRPRLVRPVDGEVYRLQQRRLQRRIAEQAHRVACHGAVVAGAFERVGQRVVALDQGLRLQEIAVALVELLDGALPELAIDGAAAQKAG